MHFREASFTFKSRTVGRSANHLYAELLFNQRLDSRRLGELQERRYSDMLHFAMQNVDYYRDSFRAAGLTASDLRDPSAFDEVPIIDRSDLKENTADFWSKEATSANARHAQTGGSTGEPLKTGIDTRIPISALSWRMLSWWGVSPWDNVARIGRFQNGLRESFQHGVKWWPSKQFHLDASLFDVDSTTTFLKQIRRSQPRLIEGYVGAMSEFAEFVVSQDIPMASPMAVGTTAAPLTDSVRERLQFVFGAPVYDEYRSAEIPWMAGECREQDGLHVFADLRRIEVVGPDNRVLPSGEIGDLVVTDLANRVFPIIRYRIGDRGALLSRDCPCGISLPLMGPPDGRIADVLRMPDGSIMGHRLTGMFSAEPDSVRLFQIHQRSDYSIVLRVVLGDRANAEAAVDRAADTFRHRVAGRVPVTVEYVENLPHSRGKMQYILSDASAPLA